MRVLGELAALLHHGDAVAHLDRLVDVVGDEDDRLADLALEAQELVLEPLAVDRVDGAERLVHQHQRRIGGAGPAPRPRAGAARPRADRGSGRACRPGRGRPARAAPPREPGCAACPSPAGAARWRCSRPRSGAGRGRSAGSRSRSHAAAPPAGAPSTLRPSSRMSPSLMSIMRLTIRIAVVLPQPDGPTSTQISPDGHLQRQAVDSRLGLAGVAAWWRRGTRASLPPGVPTAPRCGRNLSDSRGGSRGGTRDPTRGSRPFRAEFSKP